LVTIFLLIILHLLLLALDRLHIYPLLNLCIFSFVFFAFKILRKYKNFSCFASGKKKQKKELKNEQIATFSKILPMKSSKHGKKEV
jgi:hypothetical protein